MLFKYQLQKKYINKNLIFNVNIIILKMDINKVENIPSLFQGNTILSNDTCWNDAVNYHNSEINKYQLYNTNDSLKCTEATVKMPDWYLNHASVSGRPGYGVSEDCLIDTDSSLRLNNITRDRCTNQLFERTFQAVPYLLRGTGDINKELDILTGNNSSYTIQNCGISLSEKQTYQFIPLIPHIKETIQSPKYIVPDTPQGGIDTRSYINRKHFLENCKNGTNRANINRTPGN